MLYGLRKATDEVERTGHVTSTFAALKFAHAETLVPAMCVLVSGRKRNSRSGLEPTAERESE